MYKLIRKIKLFLLGFVALTAVAGGLAMLVGLDKFPTEWLSGTFFSSYIIPAIILTVIVGGSSMLALYSDIKGSSMADLASLMAGLLLFGFITTEVITLKQVPSGPTVLEWFYWIVATIIILTSAHSYLLKSRH